MNNSTDLVWDAITNSAKGKFDYHSFEESFNEVDENFAESILLKIIIGFANEKTEEVISLEILNELLMIGFAVELEEIENLVKGKRNILKAEVFTTQMAHSLLEQGNDPVMVLKSIGLLLN